MSTLERVAIKTQTENWRHWTAKPTYLIPVKLVWRGREKYGTYNTSNTLLRMSILVYTCLREGSVSLKTYENVPRELD